MAYDCFMTSYKVDPQVPLSEFGYTAEVLNESFLVGAVVSFLRPAIFEDYTLVGLPHALEIASQANKVTTTMENDGFSITQNGPVLTAACGTVLNFFELDGELFARFDNILSTTDGELSDVSTWKLTKDTTLLFQE